MLEKLGPAEKIIQCLLDHADHLYHGRPGIVVEDPTAVTGIRWTPATHRKNEDGSKTVFRLARNGKKTVPFFIGRMNGDRRISNNGQDVGVYQPPGMLPQVATWFYNQVAEVWKLDNEFAARWASFAWKQEHRDLKVVLAAFLLVQTRKGDPVREGDEVLFFDEDYRNVGEAMMLLQEKGNDLNPKHLLRIYEMLTLPEIAKLNHEMGFGKSARKPFLGRWPGAIEKWLRYREENPKMLQGLVKAGFRTTVMALARRIGYKPTSEKFFEILRWKQKQSGDGRRGMAIGKEVKAAESWAGLDERKICERIETSRPNWKRIVGLLPEDVGVTRAVMATAIEVGALSDKDLIILTPTLEELGLLAVQDIKERLDAALAKTNDMRAANIARNVRSRELKERLEAGADQVAKKAVEDVVKDLRIYFMVDISGSMEGAIEAAKPLVANFLQAFPADKVHVAVFNTSGREITIRHHSTKGVEAAFRGISASGGTDYGAGIRALRKYKPGSDEDALFIFVGDEEASEFSTAVRTSGVLPVAFGFLKTVSPYWEYRNTKAVRDTAAQLGIPCFMIDEGTFKDPYAIARTIRTLVASTPVGSLQSKRVSLIDQILRTKILQKPAFCY